MPAFNPNIVEKVLKRCRRESVPMSETVASFILGCELSDTDSDIAFQIGRVGTELGFSPDIDVLELSDNEAVGYEVKGVRGETVSKDQLYRGLGQAQLLLTPPIGDFSDRIRSKPRVRKSYLAYPHEATNLNAEWEANFMQRLEEIPSVGVIDIQRTGFEILVEAEPVGPHPQECAEQSGVSREECLNLYGDLLRDLLREHCTGKSVKNPDRSLEVMGLEIADEYDIDFSTFT